MQSGYVGRHGKGDPARCTARPKLDVPEAAIWNAPRAIDGLLANSTTDASQRVSPASGEWRRTKQAHDESAYEPRSVTYRYNHVASLAMFRKPILKTYSRQRNNTDRDDEHRAKRRRVEVPTERSEGRRKTQQEPVRTLKERKGAYRSESSSPAPDRQIFSDDVERATPPSSPPPETPALEEQSPVTQPQAVLSPTARKPLSESHQVNTIKKPSTKNKKKSLVQLKIDLGWQTRKICKMCGMEYVPSNDEDAALHKKFHAINIGGVDLDRSIVDQLRSAKLWSNADGDFVSTATRHSSQALRNRASKVLCVVNTDLSAVTISDEELWSGARLQPVPREAGEGSCQTPKGQDEKKRETHGDRFKVFLYVRGHKCIGLCLAEGIEDACIVLDPENSNGGVPKPLSSPTASSSITVSVKPEEALLGISRIWTSNAARKQNVASTLLDCATDNFLYGLKIEKAQVAFSQPTESGCHLARKWFGQEYGWHVYVD